MNSSHRRICLEFEGWDQAMNQGFSHDGYFRDWHSQMSATSSQELG